MSLDTKLRFSGYFTERGQSNISSRLQAARDWILDDIKKNSVKSVNLKSLEKELNSLFYSNGPNIPMFVEQYQNDLLEIANRNIETVFENFNFEQATAAVKLNSKETTAALQSLTKWIQKTEENLKLVSDAIQGASKNPSKLIQIEAQLQQVINNANSFFQEANSTYNIFGKYDVYAAKDKGAQAVHLIKQMKAFDAAVRHGKNCSPQEVGAAFEKALARANAHIQNNGINHVVNRMLKDLVTGAKQTSRGTTRSGEVSYTVNFDAPLSQAEKTSFNNAGFTISDDDLAITYTYNPTSEKMGKMDVILRAPTGNINDPIETLRVSAKNWTNSHTIGSTSIDAALNRAVGNTLAELYKMSMLDSTIDVRREKGSPVVAWRCAESGHQLAKVALASDIVMGLNQGHTKSGGLANVLIINDQSHIYVKDIGQMITNMKQIDKFLKNYKPSAIEGSAKSAYQSLGNSNRTESYIGKMTSVLNKMKVSYDLSKDLSTI